MSPYEGAEAPSPYYRKSIYAGPKGPSIEV